MLFSLYFLSEKFLHEIISRSKDPFLLRVTFIAAVIFGILTVGGIAELLSKERILMERNAYYLSGVSGVLFLVFTIWFQAIL